VSALDRRSAERPDDTWVLSARGQRSFAEGAPDAAAVDFGKAFARDPRRSELVGKYALAKMVQ
jgi:hypothetical protein